MVVRGVRVGTKGVTVSFLVPESEVHQSKGEVRCPIVNTVLSALVGQRVQFSVFNLQNEEEIELKCSF